MDVSVDSDEGILSFGPNHDFHLGRCMLKALKEFEEKTFQIETTSGAEETFGSFRLRSIRLAVAMKRRGLKIGDIALICGMNHNDIVVPFVSCLYLGIVPANIAHGMHPTELKHLFSKSNPSIVFSDTDMVESIRNTLGELKMDIEIIAFGPRSEIHGTTPFEELILPTGDEDQFKCEDFDPDSTTALVMCSSGTTGMQKLVAYSHKGFTGAWLATSFFDRKHSLHQDWVFINWSAMMWATAMFSVVGCLLRGMTRLHFAQPLTGEVAKNAIEKYKPRATILNPISVYLLLKHSDKIDLSSFRWYIIGGGSISQTSYDELKERCPDAVVRMGYGMSEMGLTCINPSRESNCPGKIYPWIQWKIVDLETAQTLGSNQCGELHLKSEWKFQGYLNDPESTKASMSKDGFYMSGDVARYDDDGYIYILDRIKDIIKYKQQHVSTSELENIVGSVPGVFSCAVVGVPYEKGYQIPMAFVQLIPGAKTTAHDITEKVKRSTSHWKHLDGGVVFLDRLPTTYSGKINRKAIHDMKMQYVGKFT